MDYTIDVPHHDGLDNFINSGKNILERDVLERIIKDVTDTIGDRIQQRWKGSEHALEHGNDAGEDLTSTSGKITDTTRDLT